MAEFAALVGLILTVVALGLAVFQTMQARSQERELRKHEQSLSTIAASLSTRYIGPFPDYLATAIGVIDRAKQDLLIINDNPAPAYFSSPTIWIDYRRAIEYKMHGGVDVTLISPGPARRLQRMHDQFSDELADWGNWCGANGKAINYFLKNQYPELEMAKIDAERFMGMLVDTQQRLTADVFSHAACIEIDNIVAMQVWIADKNEAVFTIETTAAHSLSHGLYTSDPKFVAALYAMAELYRKKIPSLPPPRTLTPPPV